MKRAHVQAVALVLPLVALLAAAYLLFTDPSDTSFECPGTTWTLLHQPAPAAPGLGADFFDAGPACNSAAGDRARAASVVMLTALSLLLVAGAADVAARRRVNQ